jgi:hypothetical protein
MVGISEKRAIWVADWCQKKLDHTSVLMQEVMEVFGQTGTGDPGSRARQTALGSALRTAAVPSGLFCRATLEGSPNIEADPQGRREGGRRHGGGRRMGIYGARRAEGLLLVRDGTHEKECGFNSCLDLAWVPREQM